MALPIALSPVFSLILLGVFGGPGVMIVAATLAALLIVAYSRPMEFKLGAPEVALGILAIAVAIGVVHGGGPGVRMLVFHSLLPFFASWVLGRALARITGSGETIWWTAIAFVIISAPLGILEATTRSDVIVYPDADLVTIGATDLVRPNGLFATDIDFALSITICVALVMGGRAPLTRTSWVIPIALLGTVAVVLSSFRTGWIVLAALWIWWLLKKGKYRWVIAGAAAAAIVIGFALLVGAADTAYFQERVTNPSNIDARSEVFEETWDVFASDPIIGVGLNAFQIDPLVLSSTSSVNTPHNLWLGTFAELGLLGGFALITIAALTARMCWDLTRRSRPLPVGGRGTVWACVVLIPFSLGFQLLTVPVSAMLAGLALGSVRGLFLSDGETEVES